MRDGEKYNIKYIKYKIKCVGRGWTPSADQDFKLDSPYKPLHFHIEVFNNTHQSVSVSVNCSNCVSNTSSFSSVTFEEEITGVQVEIVDSSVETGEEGTVRVSLTAGKIKYAL